MLLGLRSRIRFWMLNTYLRISLCLTSKIIYVPWSGPRLERTGWYYLGSATITLCAAHNQVEVSRIEGNWGEIWRGGPRKPRLI